MISPEVDASQNDACSQDFLKSHSPHCPQTNIKGSTSSSREEVTYLPKETLNLTKFYAGRNCGNTVGVDLEVIRWEEADRGWIRENGLT